MQISPDDSTVLIGAPGLETKDPTVCPAVSAPQLHTSASATSRSSTAFSAKLVKPTPLRAGQTTCNGAYLGTGSSVVVPASATCTLLSGTHVKLAVVVQSGGTLHINGVTIGGQLNIAGNATVCGSRIGLGVKATRGSLALGGPGCAGNKITGNVLVQHDANNVTVQRNKITGNLTVKYGSGATDSIISNTVSAGLLVGYSGPPITISHNHAYTARCVYNKGQTGSGNVAQGKNTCPH